MREVGVVYDLNIESKIDLAGNAIIKICIIDHRNIYSTCYKFLTKNDATYGKSPALNFLYERVLLHSNFQKLTPLQ